MTGTRAMYEYAAMATGLSICGAMRVATRMEVGPSAPPTMPMLPASCALKPSRIAPMKVTNMPSCAAAPRSRDFGLAISGPKSVIAPTPRKISGGSMPISSSR